MQPTASQAKLGKSQPIKNAVILSEVRRQPNEVEGARTATISRAIEMHFHHKPEIEAFVPFVGLTQ